MTSYITHSLNFTIKMDFKTDAFIKDSSMGWEIVAPGMKRKIICYDERMMLVKVSFEKDAVGMLHHHYHTQISYVGTGIFVVEIAGKKEVLKSGDVFYAAPNQWHGVVCLEAGELIDMFSPYREDFVEKG